MAPSHRQDPYRRLLGEQLPLFGDELEEALDALLNDSSEPLEFSDTEYSTDTGRSSPLSSFWPEKAAVYTAESAAGSGISMAAPGADDDEDGDDEAEDDDDDGQTLTRRLVSMAAADLRVKASGRSGGSRSAATPATQTTEQTPGKPFKFRCDAPVFTPTARQVGSPGASEPAP